MMSPTRADRPVFGSLACSPRELQEAPDRLAARLMELSGTGGGIVVVPFTERREKAAATVLRRARGLFLSKGKTPIPSLSPLTRPFIEPEMIEGPIVFVEHAPRILNFDRHAEGLLVGGKAVVATGLWEEWDKSPLGVPFEWDEYLGPEVTPSDDERERWEAEVRRFGTAQGKTQAEELLRLVLATDAWGGPLPIHLLAKAVGMELGRAGTLVEKYSDEGLLHWVQTDNRAPLLVTTSGERLSRAVLRADGWGPDVVVEQWKKVLAAAQPHLAADRLAILRLLHGLALASKARWELLGVAAGLAALRELAAAAWPNISQGIDSPVERAAWGRLGAGFGIEWPDAAPLVARAELEIGEGRCDQTEGALEAAERVTPGAPRTVLARARLSLAKDQRSAAAELFRSLQEVPGFRLASLEGLASVADAEGWSARAEELRAQVLVEDPEHVSTLLSRAGEAAKAAERSLLDRNFDRAADALRRAVQTLKALLALEPLNRKGLGIRASAELLRVLADRGASCLMEFWRAQAAAPALGLSGSTPSELEPAKEAVREFLAVGAGSAEGLVVAGRLAALIGDLSLAKKRLHEALEARPGNPEALFSLAEIACREGDRVELEQCWVLLEEAVRHEANAGWGRRLATLKDTFEGR